MQLGATSTNRSAELLALIVAIPAIDDVGIFAAHLALTHYFLHSLIEPRNKAGRCSSSRPIGMRPCMRCRYIHAARTSSLLCRRSVIAARTFLEVHELATIPNIDRAPMHFSLALRAEIHARSPFTIEEIREEEITEPDNSAWPTSSQVLYL